MKNPDWMNVSPMAGLNLRPPAQLNMNEDEGLLERWKMWKLQFQVFRKLSRLPSAEKEFQMAMFRYAIGEQAVCCINTFPCEVDKDPGNWENAMNKLECYCLGFTNDTFERYKFNCRDKEPGEFIYQFVQALRFMAITFGFCNCMND
ncbi:hypothetical protein PHET_10469 [Paragonimus heterotremus]|uniref:Uncharacterized protein n=1 Tax=Paragonimus heterotremus TaxID=100268 RepID=A0A8J4WMH4_9TREM|nr:hypothetical protein PHET_10469 [Paragonimus heterotremus]